MRSSGRAIALLACTLIAGSVACHGASAATSNSIAVTKKLGAPPAGVADLKFQDLFKMPVGDLGLEPSEKLRALDGKRVRIVGYMIQQSVAPQGSFLLSPLPEQVSDEDEQLADDLPASTVAVVVPGAAEKSISWLRGLVQVTGVLHVGAKIDVPSGRVCPVQITLDPQWARALVQSGRAHKALPASGH